MWILVLSLLSNPNGQYAQSFDTEKECVFAMNKFIRYNDTNPDVKYIGCAKSDLALNDEE